MAGSLGGDQAFRDSADGDTRDFTAGGGIDGRDRLGACVRHVAAAAIGRERHPVGGISHGYGAQKLQFRQGVY